MGIVGFSCLFCKKYVPIDKWKEHQRIHGLPAPTREKYRKLLELWKADSKPIIKGNVMEYYNLI